MSKATPGFPNLFEYENYRKFLTDAYHAMKARDKKFSFRYFARIAGFNSHNFLRMVMNGESNLSPDSISKISKAFKFNPEETKFFENLVYLNQSTTNEDKQIYAREILRSQSYRRIHPLEESKYQFFSRWYVSAIRDLVGLPEFQDDPAWIADHVIPKIKPAQAERALQDLLKLGLLKRDASGKLVQSDATISTPAEVSSAYVANWHKQYLKLAAQSIDSIPREQRDISAVTFVFSKRNIKAIKEVVANFRNEILRLSDEQETKDVLFQFNIQFFPLGETGSDGDS